MWSRVQVHVCGHTTDWPRVCSDTTRDRPRRSARLPAHAVDTTFASASRNGKTFPACAAELPGRSQSPSNAGRSTRSGKRSEEHTSELQSLMRISYAVFCLKKKQHNKHRYQSHNADNIKQHNSTT